MGAILKARQTNEIPNSNGYNQYSDGNSSAIVFVVRWVVVGALVLLVAGIVIFGRMHAKNRMKKSLPLLRYHNWLLSTRERNLYNQRYVVHTQPPDLPLGNLPPPAYKKEYAGPPVYDGSGAGPSGTSTRHADLAVPPPDYDGHVPSSSQETGVATGSTDAAPTTPAQAHITYM